MMIKYLVFVIGIYFINECHSKIMCKDENNNDLDWYIIIKYPDTYNFFYLSSASGGKAWQLPNYALNTDKNMVALTLKQAYDSVTDKTFYAFYNDEKSKNYSSSSGGHLKGVVNFDKETGYWLVHSVPKFPPNKAYDYPNPQSINGQSFICVSLYTKDLTSIVNQLLMMFAIVYSHNLPLSFSSDTALEYKLNLLIDNIHQTGEISNTFNFTTVNNVPLIHFGKSKSFFNDLYGDVIAPALKSTLYVESWRNGNGGRLPSNCTSNIKTYNIIKVKIHKTEFDESHDHSKWAVTSLEGIPGTCIGDLNRMKSQFGRGGGSLCILQANVRNAFFSSINEFEKCQQ